MGTSSQSIKDEQVIKFLLAEYELIRSLRSDLIHVGESRVNFFLATLSGAFVGLALLSKSSVLGDTLTVINGSILAGLFFIGVITFLLSVERDIRVNFYARGLNRIRQYFAHEMPSIKDYLILPIHDDIPSFNTIEFSTKSTYLLNLSGIIRIINSVM